MTTASSPSVTPLLSFSALSRATLIIPAAGSGSRLQKEIPKPYISIAGRTILEHTVRPFLGIEALQQIIIATSQSYISRAREILESSVPSAISYRVIEGGSERQHSIRHGLESTFESDIIIIHDAVRPFVRTSDIRNCCKTALEMGAAVLGVPAKDTIKQVDADRIIQNTPSREKLWQAQTPQVFKAEVIKEAHRKAFEDNFVGTDDASLVERLGYAVKMVEGKRTNFKITYPLDLKLAQILLEKENDK